MLRGVALILASTLVASAAYAGPWTPVTEDEGIKVWQREVEGTAFVEFRGRAVIDADIRQILAVLRDHKRKTEWMHHCVVNRLVLARGAGRVVVYNRTGSGFPLVQDRDVVVKTSMNYDVKARRIHIEAHATEHPGAPVVDGVVRMPRLDLVWDLVMLDEARTEVTYQVQADPGGLLPAWVVNLASRKIPLRTLANLRNQVKKDYARSRAIVDVSFDWTSIGL